MLLAMRRLQKVPNETKLQRIVEVLDDDHDGNININLALKVSLISSSASCWGLWLGSLGHCFFFFCEASFLHLCFLYGHECVCCCLGGSNSMLCIKYKSMDLTKMPIKGMCLRLCTHVLMHLYLKRSWWQDLRVIWVCLMGFGPPLFCAHAFTCVHCGLWRQVLLFLMLFLLWVFCMVLFFDCVFRFHHKCPVCVHPLKKLCIPQVFWMFLLVGWLVGLPQVFCHFNFVHVCLCSSLPEMPLCSWWDDKSQELTDWPRVSSS